MKITGIREKAICCVFIIVVLAGMLYQLCWNNIYTRIVTQSETASKINEDVADLTAVEDSRNRLKETAQQLRSDISEKQNSYTGNGITKEEFMVYFNNTTSAYNLKVMSFAYQGGEQLDSVTKMKYAAEVRGSMDNLNNLVQSFDQMGIKYSVGDISLRQDGTYGYLKRYYDTISDFSWYNNESSNDTREDIQKLNSGDYRMFVTLNLLSYAK